MPRWIARLIWRMRGPRRVMVHIEGMDSSIEGILFGRWGGHYVLQRAALVEETDRKMSLSGAVEIPAERVLFLQVLG